MPDRDRHIPDLVSKAQAAEILGVSHQAVQQMVANGRLKGAQVGTTWVFRRVVVESLAARQSSQLPGPLITGRARWAASKQREA